MADISYEVDEQLRAARFQILLRRGWPYAAGIVAVALALALAAWLLNQREIGQASAASERYAAAMQLLSKGDTQGADRGFADLARSGPRAYRALADMQQAGIALKRNDAPAAIALLDQTAKLAPNPIMSDAAGLEAAYASMDVGSYGDVRDRLLPLSKDGRPYRIMAREALGMWELQAGKLAEARGDLQVVSLSQDATDAMRNRAAAALGLLKSGDWTALAPLAKASAGLTPQAPPPTVAQPGQGGPPPSGEAPQGAPDQGQAQPTSSPSDQSGTAQ